MVGWVRAVACPVLPPVASLAGLVGLWWGVVAVAGIPPFFLPSPVDVARAGAGMPGYLAVQAGVTVWETLAGFGVAVVAGFGFAMVVGLSAGTARAVIPPLVAINAVPKVAVAPLLILWLGFGTVPAVALVALICFFPIVLATAAGLTATPVELIELAASLTGSRMQTFVKVRIRWAVPQITVGLKVAIQLAVIGAVVAEVTAPHRGLGALIVTAATNADTPLAFAAIVLLAVINMGLYGLVSAAGRIAAPWATAITA